jgi:hypothetical protein
LYLAAETNIRLIGVGEYPLLHCCCCFDAVPLLGTFHGRPRRTLPDSAKKIATKSGDIPHQTNRISRIVLLHVAIRAGGFAPEASIAKKNSPYGTGAGKETISSGSTPIPQSENLVVEMITSIEVQNLNENRHLSFCIYPILYLM